MHIWESITLFSFFFKPFLLVFFSHFDNADNAA